MVKDCIKVNVSQTKFHIKEKREWRKIVIKIEIMGSDLIMIDVASWTFPLLSFEYCSAVHVLWKFLFY